MEIKFILLIIGLFIFTLGYVNQNKYNCNITPSLDRYQEQDLKKLFNKGSAFLDYERTLKNEDGTETIIRNIGARPQPVEIGSQEYISKLPDSRLVLGRQIPGARGQGLEYGSLEGGYYGQ